MNLATDQSANPNDFSLKAIQFMAMRDAVIDRWESEVRARVKGADGLRSPVLTNTLPAFYDNIAEALSPAHPRCVATQNTNAATVHGDERARLTRFGPDQIVHEYQIFREAIFVVAKSRVKLTEHEIEIIDQSVDAATREAVRAFSASQSELRQKVAAALSHDMRTPLAIIVNGAQLISVASGIDTARNLARKVESSAVRLGTMMNELLDALTKKSDLQFPLNPAEFDVLQMVNEAIEQYCEQDDCRVALEHGESVVGNWCWNSLRRALENLINNALKYGDGNTIAVRVCQFRGRLILSVHNWGNPIPKESHSHIFEYLQRESDAATVTGWGIGLQFVKAVAEGHGGSVTVDSSAEAGTTFSIDIPLDCRSFIADKLP